MLLPVPILLSLSFWSLNFTIPLNRLKAGKAQVHHLLLALSIPLKLDLLLIPSRCPASNPSKPFQKCCLISSALKASVRSYGRHQNGAMAASGKWFPRTGPTLLLRFSTELSGVQSNLKWQLDMAQESVNHIVSHWANIYLAPYCVPGTGFSSENCIPGSLLFQSFRLLKEEFLSI